jgi:hypothetical protein
MRATKVCVIINTVAFSIKIVRRVFVRGKL